MSDQPPPERKDVTVRPAMIDVVAEAIAGHVAALRDTGQEVPEEATPVVMTVDLATEKPAA